MIGTNHALAGGLLAKYLPLPVALPLAFLSHFCLDALPHYGLPHEARDRSLLWKIVFVGDFVIAFGLAAWQIWYQHYDLFLGGLFAIAPDFVWVFRVIKTRSFNLSGNVHWFTKWHARIQVYERPWGLWIELPVAVVLFYYVFLNG